MPSCYSVTVLAHPIALKGVINKRPLRLNGHLVVLLLLFCWTVLLKCPFSRGSVDTFSRIKPFLAACCPRLQMEGDKC